MSLRKKIANSPRFNRAVEAFFAGYLRFAFRTSRWTREGFDEFDTLIAAGEPVIFAIWHQRLILSPYIFRAPRGARICAITSTARGGRLAGQIFVRFGWETIAMGSQKRGVAPTREGLGSSREVLKRVREGCSIGLACDGPRGPARKSSGVPITWARSTGCRVFVVSFAQRRVLRLPTWDKQMLPVPFSRGVMLCREWTEVVPRKLSEEATEALRLSLETALDEITDAADSRIGNPIERR